MGILLYFKLALRMLIKYPLLTIVGGAGTAFGLAAGVAGFEVRTKMIDPTLPLDEGTRIVGLRNWDVLRDRAAALGLAEFTAWREQLRNVEGADGWTESQYLSRALAVSSGVALLLSLMSVYAVMAFSVVQRTKEIGMRVALGAERGRIVATIVRRPLAQIGVGIVVGGAVVSLLFVGMFNSAPAPLEAGLMVAYATLMLAVCLSACIVPIRRALRLEPSQVLRST